MFNHADTLPFPLMYYKYIPWISRITQATGNDWWTTITLFHYCTLIADAHNLLTVSSSAIAAILQIQLQNASKLQLAVAVGLIGLAGILLSIHGLYIAITHRSATCWLIKSIVGKWHKSTYLIQELLSLYAAHF